MLHQVPLLVLVLRTFQMLNNLQAMNVKLSNNLLRNVFISYPASKDNQYSSA